MSDIYFTAEGGSDVILEVTNGEVVEMHITEPAPVEITAMGGQGAPGKGVPTGGTIGQRLVKTGPADYQTGWADQGVAGADKSVQFNDAGSLGADERFKWDKNTRTLRIGVEDDNPLPNNPLAMIGAIDSYLQVNVRNTTEGESASSDYVATADNGTDEDNYVDMGINSSVYDDPDFEAFKANDSYLLSAGADLDLAAIKPGQAVRIIAGGPLDENEVARFAPDGLTLPDQYPVTRRPEVFYGTGSPPSATGLLDGTLFIKYKE